MPCPASGVQGALSYSLVCRASVQEQGSSWAVEPNALGRNPGAPAHHLSDAGQAPSLHCHIFEEEVIPMPVSQNCCKEPVNEAQILRKVPGIQVQQMVTMVTHVGSSDRVRIIIDTHHIRPRWNISPRPPSCSLLTAEYHI